MKIKPSMGVSVAVIDSGLVLLTLREDFEVWCLPGGAVDSGESLGEAARREVFEEVGLEVRLSRLVGIYSETTWYSGGLHNAFFVAHPDGGQIRPDPAEVLEARYFGPEELPQPIMYGHSRRISDALTGATGLVVAQDRPWPFPPGVTREEIYALRDRSGLSRQEFYLHHFAISANSEEKIEVGEV